MKYGIIGGGILGLAVAYELTRGGQQVVVFEGRDRPGGLLQFFNVDGAWIDRYYHCILAADTDLLDLVDELGLQSDVRFAPTRQGVYRDGRLHSMSSGKDFLLFPPLNPIERVRLAYTIAHALLVDRFENVEQIGVEDWLVGLGGRGVFEKLWKPLLKAKFDADFQSTPATYIWSRLKRTTPAGAATGKPGHQGYFVGSYRVLVDRIVERIEAGGSEVRCGSRVQQVLLDDGRCERTAGRRRARAVGWRRCDDAAAHRAAIAARQTRSISPRTTDFLGVVCGLLLLDRSLTPYYTLNIADDSIPFTGLIETTNMIAPEHVGGYHLLYLPKYVGRTSDYLKLSDDELKALYVHHLQRMFPDFDPAWIKHAFVFRERFVEPLHQIGKPRPTVPFTTAVDGLFVVNNGQIYPELTNCQASVRHARRALPTLLAYEPAPGPQSALVSA